MCRISAASSVALPYPNGQPPRCGGVYTSGDNKNEKRGALHVGLGLLDSRGLIGTHAAAVPGELLAPFGSAGRGDQRTRALDEAQRNHEIARRLRDPGIVDHLNVTPSLTGDRGREWDRNGSTVNGELARLCDLWVRVPKCPACR